MTASRLIMAGFGSRVFFEAQSDTEKLKKVSDTERLKKIKKMGEEPRLKLVPKNLISILYFCISASTPSVPLH